MKAMGDGVRETILFYYSCIIRQGLLSTHHVPGSVHRLEKPMQFPYSQGIQAN